MVAVIKMVEDLRKWQVVDHQRWVEVDHLVKAVLERVDLQKQKQVLRDRLVLLGTVFQLHQVLQLYPVFLLLPLHLANMSQLFEIVMTLIKGFNIYFINKNNLNE